MPHKQIASLLALIIFSTLQLTVLRAEPCSDIGGAGMVANGCGVGGTGHASTRQEIGGTGHSQVEKGIGGTGHSQPDKGIGGTGQVANTSRTGIGGTGHSDGGIGGTGIVGIVTAFGSIWVNGIEVQYDAQTPVADNAEKATTRDLAIGQVVTIKADESNSAIKAEQISVVNAVAGPISAVDTANNTLTILGQTVSISPRTMFNASQGDINLQALSPGENVKISGLRMANGKIVASRVAQTPHLAESSLVGPITKIGKSSVEVYGLQIETDKANQLKLGQEILVTGKLDGSKMVAREIVPSPATQLLEKAREFSLQGYAGEINSQNQLKVGAMEVVVPAQSARVLETEGKLVAGELILVRGHIDQDHRIIADRIEIERDLPDRVQRNSISHPAQRQEVQDRIERSQDGDRMEIDRLDNNSYIDHPEHYDSPNHSSGIESHGSKDTTESSGHSH